MLFALVMDNWGIETMPMALCTRGPSKHDIITWSQHDGIAWSQHDVITWSHHDRIAWSQHDIITWSQHDIITWSYISQYSKPFNWSEMTLSSCWETSYWSSSRDPSLISPSITSLSIGRRWPCRHAGICHGSLVNILCCSRESVRIAKAIVQSVKNWCHDKNTSESRI